MNVTEYQSLAMRTKSHPDPNCDYLELARIGLIGELGEIAEMVKKDKYHGKMIDRAELLKECGDFMWYLALYCDVTDTNMEDSTKNIEAMSSAEICIMLLNPVSIIACHGIDKSLWAVFSCIYLMHTLLYSYEYTLSDALELNIAKLKLRYPNGFDINIAATHNSE
jgi:NTP pyrophosphatase (non-canonical NTP hydrolase)